MGVAVRKFYYWFEDTMRKPYVRFAMFVAFCAASCVARDHDVKILLALAACAPLGVFLNQSSIRRTGDT
jgi:hypothetical protein